MGHLIFFVVISLFLNSKIETAQLLAVIFVLRSVYYLNACINTLITPLLILLIF